MYFLIYLLFLHYVGDFLLQNDWMTKGKSKSIYPLFVHVLIYTLVLWIGTLYCSPAFALTNALIHFIIDYNTSKINSKFWEEKKMHSFFCSLGADQLFHTITIILTYPLLSFYVVL